MAADEPAQQRMDQVDPPRLDPTPNPPRVVTIPEEIDPALRRGTDAEPERDPVQHVGRGQRRGSGHTQAQADHGGGAEIEDGFR